MTNISASPAAEEILALLRSRDGQLTSVRLLDGRTFAVHNVAWGQDDNDPEYHITTNVSPAPAAGAVCDFFVTQLVAQVIDPNSGTVLYSRRD